MKTIYFLMDGRGYKFTACMFTNRRACQKHLERMEAQYPDKKYTICTGYAFSK